MISAESKTIAADAKRIYEQRLRSHLEERHFGRYIAIEPTSGDYFVGASLDEAVNAALSEHPDRLTQTIRIGNPACMRHGDYGTREPKLP